MTRDCVWLGCVCVSAWLHVSVWSCVSMYGCVSAWLHMSVVACVLVWLYVSYVACVLHGCLCLHGCVYLLGCVFMCGCVCHAWSRVSMSSCVSVCGCMAAWVMHGYVCSCVVTCVHAWLCVFVHGYMCLVWLCVFLLWSRLQFSQWLLTQKLGGWDVFGVAFLGARLITPPKPWGLVSGQCGDVTALYLCLEPCCSPLLYPHLCPPPYLKPPVAWQPLSHKGPPCLCGFSGRARGGLGRGMACAVSGV